MKAQLALEKKVAEDNEAFETEFEALIANTDVLFRGGEELQELAGVMKTASDTAELDIYDVVTTRMTLAEIKKSAAYAVEEAEARTAPSDDEAQKRLKKAREELRFRVVNPAAFAKTSWFAATSGALDLAAEELKKFGPLSSPGIWAYLEEKIKNRQMTRRTVEEFLEAAHRSALSASFFYTLPAAVKQLIAEGVAAGLYAGAGTHNFAAYTGTPGGKSVLLDKDGKPRFSRSHKSKPGEPPVWKLSGGHFPQSVRSQGRDRGRVATGVPPASESGSDFDLAGWAR